MIKYSTIWFFGSTLISGATVVGLIVALATHKFSWGGAGAAAISLMVAGLMLLYGKSVRRVEDRLDKEDDFDDE